MTIYEVENIEHCTVTSVSNGTLYTIVAHEGWYMHLNDGDEETANIWKGAMILRADDDDSQLEIRAEADLPPDADICASHHEEVM